MYFAQIVPQLDTCDGNAKTFHGGNTHLNFEIEFSPQIMPPLTFTKQVLNVQW